MQALGSKQSSNHSIARYSSPACPPSPAGVHQHGCGTKTPRVVLARSATDSRTDDITHPNTVRQLQCLKEWAPVCAALGHGEQTILLRKGGIREPTFTPKANEFLLFPTSFHTDAQLLKPGVAERYQQEVQMEPKAMPQIPLKYFAVITGSWTTRDPNVLEQLDALHVYGAGFLETRLKWRSKDPLTLLEVRTYMLDQELVVPPREQYFGCFSWVELLPEDAGTVQAEDANAGVQGRFSIHPALADSQFKEKQDILRQQLEQLSDAQELVLV